MGKYRPLFIMFINRAWVEAATGRTIDDINPATGETTAKVALGGKGDVERAVAAAPRVPGESWFDTTDNERSTSRLRLADAMEEHGDECARLESIAVGKPISASLGDIPGITIALRFFAAAARCLESKAGRGSAQPEEASAGRGEWSNRSVK
jgi:acyl-CoA reductase-like NAD-dependent aldehyde dehydrogenase